jgi:hypothetical protein
MLMRLIRSTPHTAADFLRAMQILEDIRAQFLQRPRIKATNETTPGSVG